MNMMRHSVQNRTDVKKTENISKPEQTNEK